MKEFKFVNESGARVVLASKSPRRQELLKNLSVKFEVITSDFDEKLISHEGKSPSEFASELAAAKVAAVADKLNGDAGRDVLIIGADTIVVMDGHIMGQPEDEADAKKMLSKLSGADNEVVTGVSVLKISGGKKSSRSGHESTRVFFKKLSSYEIDRYVKTGEPMDKAGAYGIQGFASLFVEKIDGCYFNVVGLPIMRLSKLFAEHGYCLI